MIIRTIRIIIFCFVASFFVLLNIQSENISKRVYQIDIRKSIDWTTQIYLSKGLEQAQSCEADVILINLNTYGGLMEATDSMRTAILYNPIPVYVFIDNNAASAGALISLACEKIFMRQGASIGAASVVDQAGEIAPDKYQSYMRSMMRSTVEAHGQDTIINGMDTVLKWKRNPEIAEAMVDARIQISGLTDSGKVLTLTADEAIRWGFCDGIATSTDEIITRYLAYADYEIISYQPTWTDDLMGFLMNPFFQSVLILLIVGGIYFELQTPGIGFPLATAVIAAILYFSPLYFEGLAEYWEIALFILGLILIAIEIFVTPGFGFIGISGMGLIVAGFVLSLLNNVDFNFENVTKNESSRAFLIVFSGLGLGSAIVLWLTSRIGTSGMFRRVSLDTDLSDAMSFSIDKKVVGQTGQAMTVLRPSGKVVIEGKMYDAISETGFIEKGASIQIIRIENAQVYVERVLDV